MTIGKIDLDRPAQRGEHVVQQDLGDIDVDGDQRSDLAGVAPVAAENEAADRAVVPCNAGGLGQSGGQRAQEAFAVGAEGRRIEGPDRGPVVVGD